MNTPSYIKLLKTGHLEQRVSTLNKMLENCVLCPHQCKVTGNRYKKTS